MVALATGCGERAEPTGHAVPLYPVTVEGAGDQPAVVTSAPRRIAALGAASRQILRALGAGEHVLDLDPRLDGPALVRVLGRLRPDLIVVSRTAAGIEPARRGLLPDVPLYVMPDASIDEVQRAINEIAVLVDRPIAGRRIAESIERRRQRVAERLRGVPVKTVFVDTGFFATISERSLVGDVVREAHGQSVVGAHAEPGEPVDLDRLRMLNPRAYLALSESRTTLAQLRENPKARRLRAVRAGRFGIVSSRLLEPGPRIAAGLEAVARVLHPNAFR